MLFRVKKEKGEKYGGTCCSQFTASLEDRVPTQKVGSVPHLLIFAMFVSIADWLHDYWLNDSPALHGLERIALYSALLALCLLSHHTRPPVGDSPLQAPEIFRGTHVALFFERRGLATLLPQAWLTSPAAHPSLLALRNVTVAAWVCCILGLGGHGPVVLTALGVFLLEMFKVCQSHLCLTLITHAGKRPNLPE